ncbi:MAG TPA: sensor histidine kinase [Fluviicola sp.]|nr:sensor histidine kinase [Fluviicola sp.]
MSRVNTLENWNEIEAYIEVTRLRLAKRMSRMFLLVFIILSFSYYTESFESFCVMLLGILLSLINLYFIKYKNNYIVSFYIYSIGGVFVTGYALLFFHDTVHLVDVLWMLAGVSLSFVGLGKRLGIVLMTSALLIITAFIYYSLNIHIVTIEERTFFQKATLVVEMVSAFLVNFYFIYLFIELNKFHSLKIKESYEDLLAQNKLITAQNNEKTVLVKEIHHRVKNNLQIVVSLLRMQSNEIENPEVKLQFQESVNRIMTMSLIHQKLYQNEDLSRINIQEYLEELTKDIIQIQNDQLNLSYTINTTIDKIGLKTIIPLGLLINELVSNSLKHAFTTVTQAKIEILIEAIDEDQIRLEYTDNGSWKSPENQTRSFGLILIDTLTEQLEGKKSIEKSRSGTRYIFTLHNMDEPEILIQKKEV